MKIAIVGSRSFSDYDMMQKFIKSKINIDIITDVISGGADGADTLGRLFAKNNGINLVEFYPNWQKYGKTAGHIRNKSIVSASDVVFAFWDGVSPGTKNSISHCKKLKLPLYLCEYNTYKPNEVLNNTTGIVKTLWGK